MRNMSTVSNGIFSKDLESNALKMKASFERRCLIHSPSSLLSRESSIPSSHLYRVTPPSCTSILTWPLSTSSESTQSRCRIVQDLPKGT